MAFDCRSGIAVGAIIICGTLHISRSRATESYFQILNKNFYGLVVVERVVYDAILARVDECARGLEALMRLYAPKNLDDWVDNESAQSILKLGLRSMQTMRSSGKIGYSIIDGKVFYPMSEIDRVLKQSYVNDGGQGARADFG